MPVRPFEREPGARAEALDALVYAAAARNAIALFGLVGGDKKHVDQPAWPALDIWA